MVIVLELAQPALLIINVTLQSPRQVLKSSFPVSTILPSCRQRSFSLPFLGAKSLLRRKSLRSCFQSKPVYGVPATAKSSTKIHFHGSCFLPWRVSNSLCQWENSSVQLALEWNVTTFQSDVWPFTSIFHTLCKSWHQSEWRKGSLYRGPDPVLTVETLFHLFAKAATAIYGGEGRLRLLVKCRYDKVL